MTLKTVSAIPTYMTHISGKFQWHPSTE